jgi:cytochrome c
LAKQPNRVRDDPWDYGRILPIRSPYAPTVWDYINRGMPLNREGTLTVDEVYALTALLLYWNGIIAEDAVMDQRTLPAVQMPNRENWAPLPDWQPGTPRLAGYPY